MSPEMFLPFATGMIADKCMLFVPKKRGKKKVITSFHRKRRKLAKSHIFLSEKTAQILHVEELICESHRQEKLHDEEIAVTKIKMDPNYFFRYAKKHSICQSEVGPFLGPTKALISNKYEICCLLLDQFNSVFTKPNPDMIVTNPFSFFHTQSSMNEDNELYLTNIVLSEKIIIEAIHELSTRSAAGPDGIPSSLLVNCATELAPLLLIVFTHSLSSGVVPPSFKLAAITPVFKSGDRTTPNNYRPISLTSVFSKVLERIIRKQVSSFMDKKGCLNSTQHGFRSGRSCLSALLSVFNDIMHMLEDGGSVDMYLDFSKAFDKVDHGILLHKLKALRITGHLGIWFFNFLTRRSHFVRLPGAISGDSPVLSGVPQGTVLGPLLFLIMLADINKDISESNLISFADDTRIYSKINDVTDCDTLQQDLNHVYDWASINNMFFNTHKFYYVSFSPNKYSSLSNVYINPEYNIISPSSNVLNLGVYMSRNCTFDFHVASVYKRCSNLTGWILRTFTTRETITMMTLFKSLVLSRLDYASQLWSPHLLKSIYLIEKVQRSFTKHITGIKNKPYDERLKLLNLYSVQRRRDRYQIIYLWKIIEGLVPNLSAPITCTYSKRRGLSCVVSHVNMGRLGTLSYNSFRWRSIRMFNKLPKYVRIVSSCSIDEFKSQLDKHLRSIVDLPCRSGFNNSLDGGDCLDGGHYADDLAAN